MRYSVERLIGGEWRVVADEVCDDSADRAIALTRDGPGLYRVSSLAGLSPTYYEVPGYGLARAVDPATVPAVEPRQ